MKKKILTITHTIFYNVWDSNVYTNLLCNQFNMLLLYNYYIITQYDTI